MASDEPPRIGTRIRRARERLRMTQSDLAGKLKVSRSAVNSWENDRTYPKNSIGALEHVLGIDLDGDGITRDDTGHRIATTDELLERTSALEQSARERNGNKAS